jgi:DNA modification methylase
VKPYWTSDDGTIFVYHARYEDVLAAGVVPVRDVALVHDDPPYGVGERLWKNRKDKPDGVPRPNAKMGGGKVRAWTNLGGPLRIFRHWWRGALRKTEKEDKHLHPTQKPIALCSWVYQRAKLKRGDLVFVPHGGSGPDLPACAAMGLRLIWCDVERWCCDTAIARLGGITAERAAEPAGPLFAGVRNGL